VSERVKCLIVDDEPLAIDVIKGYVSQVPQFELVGTCSDAMQAFQVLNKEKVDLLFLDIEMPGMTGLEFIRSLSSVPHVILTTAYREYALESYEMEVVDYLLKPISFGRFFKAVSKYLKLTANTAAPQLPTNKPKERGSIYVYADKKNIKVYFEDILFIESIKDYVRIHTKGKNIVSKNTITRYEELLPDSFIRVHRSYIINLAKINAYTHHDIEIGEKEIPIGTSYKRVVMERLKGE